MTIACKWALAGVSLLAISFSPAVAQSQGEAVTANDDSVIIVEARRRDEAIQDVPVVVQAVTADDLRELNIGEFEEIETIVPGLSMDVNANGIGTDLPPSESPFDIGPLA